MFLNETEESRNVLGECREVCQRWAPATEGGFAAIRNRKTLKKWLFICIGRLRELQRVSAPTFCHGCK